MTWTAGADLASGTVVTAAVWNNYLGTSGSLNYLKASPLITGKVDIGAAGASGNQLGVMCAATTTPGLCIDTPDLYTGDQLIINYNGAARFFFSAKAATTGMYTYASDLGADVMGTFIGIQRNTHAAGTGPAAGHLYLQQADANLAYFWTDATGDLRIHTAAPTGSAGSPTVADTAGAVVGDQTSWHELKNILGNAFAPDHYLLAVLNTAVEEFTYKSSGYKTMEGQDQIFTGLVIRDKKEWFAKNCGPQQVPCLNEISAIGYLVQSIKALRAQINELEIKLLARAA